MINDRHSCEYTFDARDSFISSSDYSIYYISDYNDMEYVIRYYYTEDEDSRKETKENKEDRKNE